MANNIQNGFPVGYSANNNQYGYNANMLAAPQPSPYMQQPMNQMAQQNPSPKLNHVQWVQGINAAKAYIMEPNTTMPLWDSESQCIYWKTVDQYGRPTSFKILKYDILDEVPQSQYDSGNNYVTREQFDSLMREVRDVKSALQSNGNGNSYGSYGSNQSNLNPVSSEPASVPGVQTNQYTT